MERKFFTQYPGGIRQIFSGMQPSKGAEELAIRASSMGIDPIQYTIKAGMAAMQEGRTKAGFFGDAEEHLNSLRARVTSTESSKAIAQSAARFNKKRG
jgi:hypothetical protein